MLIQLAIRDFAIIKNLELELPGGMTVMTGETGAGKSILVDALGLALGERAGRSGIRDGCSRAEIAAAFRIQPKSEVDLLLRAQELVSSDDECILRRVLYEDGRSRAFLNGTPVPVQMLRRIGSLLVDIHGQNSHQSLIRRPIQRQILDLFAEHDARLDELAGICTSWEAVMCALEKEYSPSDRDSRLEFLHYQIQELEELGLEQAELESLEVEQRQLSHAFELREACTDLIHRIGVDDENAAGAILEYSASRMENLARLDPRIAPILDLVASAAVEVREACSELRNYADRVDTNPGRLSEVDSRLGEIDRIARKHRVRPSELSTRLELQRREAAELESSEERIRKLEAERNDLLERFTAAAIALHESRLEAADRLSNEISTNIRRLGMSDGVLRISVDEKHLDIPSRHGIDDVQFLVSTNKGQPTLPLSRVASGGELSRISLAIQTATADRAGLPCLIFDEVDVGIGGRVAEIVGQELRRLARTRQVLCVTHLPQVASQASHHIRIDKHSRGSNIQAELTPISGEARVEEIARMLGGVKITTQTVAHAREMLGNQHE